MSFDIEIDATTLNIFVEDAAIGAPVRLHRRSTGFRWYVSFAWKFTHASKGDYRDCILLLEEPGIHLHYHAQRDLLAVFENLAATNSVLYTTHLASMVDLANPERVRIVESKNNHLSIVEGVVSTQPGPMAVIETALGLTGDLGGMLGNRKVLIVEGGTDALFLNKLAGLFRKDSKPTISDQIYFWTAESASKTPMYAAFCIGQKWQAAVLLDTDEAGKKAQKKIEEMSLKDIASSQETFLKIIMLGDAANISKTDAGIEDLFPDKFYIDCVSQAYRIVIKESDLPADGSDMISARVEYVMKQRGYNGLDKKKVLTEIFKKFDSWHSVADIPHETAERASRLFAKINAAFLLRE